MITAKKKNQVSTKNNSSHTFREENPKSSWFRNDLSSVTLFIFARNLTRDKLIAIKKSNELE